MLSRKFLLVLISVPFLANCAGPTTPFGALQTAAPISQKLESFTTAKPLLLNHPLQDPTTAPGVKMSLTPDRQVLHDKMDLTVAIDDYFGVGRKSTLTLHFNGQPIRNIKNLFVPPENRKKGYFTFNSVRLRDDRDHRIVASYTGSNTRHSVKKQLLAPDCQFSSTETVQHVKGFNPDKELLKNIDRLAHLYEVNPSLMTGVVAQESAFDPKAVSWAKAIGLTQITPIADEQLQQTYPDWPRSQLIDDYPAAVIKALVQSNKVDSEQDWRLDPLRSLKGGFSHLNYMKDYWERPEAKTILQKYSPNQPLNTTNLTLASYHSGPMRVRKAIIENGANYLTNEDLNEASRYIRRVKSYCYHFAHSEAQ